MLLEFRVFLINYCHNQQQRHQWSLQQELRGTLGTLGTLGNLIFTKAISENQLDAIVMV
jgi:hypothetical protein